jgi:spore coat polysaccharide biosynthesis protein SpsF (cytidylyltransferase family)
VRIGAIVQARMSSTRLPGKSLMPLAGRPAIDWLLERLERARELDGLVVATSDEPSDDALADHCAARGLTVHRGPLDDVAGRMLAAARASGFDAFVRVSGDSPLLDQALVDRAVELMRAGPHDIVTNVRPRTFPPGQSVEVVRTAALASALVPEEREHVTGPLYGGGFDVRRFQAETPRTDVRYTLDTPEDAERLERILLGIASDHWEHRWYELPS